MMRRSFLTLLGLAPVAAPVAAEKVFAAIAAQPLPSCGTGPAMNVFGNSFKDASPSPFHNMSRGDLIVHGYRAGLVSLDELREAARDIVNMPEWLMNQRHMELDANMSLSKAAKSRLFNEWRKDWCARELLAGRCDDSTSGYALASRLLKVLTGDKT